MSAFQTGGAVRGDGLYAVRPADRVLPEALVAGDPCFVLAPRQIGKTSLCQHTMATLQARGVRCKMLDLNAIGGTSVPSLSAWFEALLFQLATSLDLDEPAPDGLPPASRLGRWLREVLADDPQPLVLFFDEIDTTLSLPFDVTDFFALLRSLHEARAQDPILQRLTFCLIGVASPSQLMRDLRRTPFNIGRFIPLEDLTREEAGALAAGFDLRPHADALAAVIAGEPAPLPAGLRLAVAGLTHAPWLADAIEALAANAAALLDAIYGWTHGHPYFTQALCADLVADALAGEPPTAVTVDAAVQRRLLRPPGPEDTNLSYARGRVERSDDRAVLVRLYRAVLAGVRVPLDGKDPRQTELLLAGFFGVDRSGAAPVLRVRNRIYATVFGLGWADSVARAHWMAEAWQRWDLHGRRDADVLRGAALAEAVAIESTSHLLPGEVELLVASQRVARQEQEQRDALRIAASETRRARLQRWMIAVLVVGLLLLAGALVRVLAAQATAEHERLVGLGRIALLTAGTGEGWVDGLTAAVDALAVDDPPPEARRGASAVVHRATTLRPSVLFDAPGQAWRTSAVSPDGRWVAVAGAAGVLLFDLRSEGGPSRLSDLAATSVSISPDGARVVATGEDAHVRLWAESALLADALAPNLPRPDPGDAKRCLDVAATGAVFGPDGGSIVTRHGDCVARVWDAQGLEPLGAFIDPGRVDGTPDRLTGARLAEGGELVTIGANGVAVLWDVATGQERGRVGPVSDWMLALDVSPDGRRVALADAGYLVRVWDLDQAQVTPPIVARHFRQVRGVRWLPDGRRLLTASEDLSVALWDAQSGTRLWRRPYPALVHSFDLSADGDLLVVAAGNGAAEVSRTSDGSVVALAPAPEGELVARVRFLPDGRILGLGDAGKVWTWDLEDDAQCCGGVTSILFPEGGEPWVSTSSGGIVRLGSRPTRPGLANELARPRSGAVGIEGHATLHESADGRVFGVFKDLGCVDAARPEAAAPCVRPSPMLDAAWSEATQRLLVWTDGLAAWDPATGDVAWWPDLPHSTHGTLLAGYGLLARDDDKHQVCSWNERGELRFCRPQADFTLQKETAGWTSIRLVGDDLLLSFNEGEVRRFDGSTGDLVWRSKDVDATAFDDGGDVRVRDAVPDPTGAWFVAADLRGRLTWWAFGGEHRAVQAHAGPIENVVLSPDSRLVLTTAVDGVVRVWDTAALRDANLTDEERFDAALVADVAAHEGAVYSAAFTPDSRSIVTGGADGRARVMVIDPGLLRARACELLHDNRAPGCAP